MKLLLIACSVILLSVNALTQVNCFYEPIEKQAKFVYDYSQTLSNNELGRLENKLTNYRDTTSSQIAIVLVDKVKCDLATAAINLGENWGVGQADNDNGIVILVAIEDRKLFIATGYGVEAYVPDVLAFRIIDNIIKPKFREYQYYEGLDEATNVLIDLLSGVYQPSLQDEPSSGGIPIWVIVLFIVVILILLSRGNGGGSQYDYGRDGKRVFGDEWGRSQGNWGDFKGGRGVFFPPTGGGSSSGGGFGGFGGGSFGGGGAGGSW